MKRAWLKKTMIALMALALVAGAFAIAPKEALAAADAKFTGSTVVNGSSATVTATITNKTTDYVYTYQWTAAAGTGNISVAAGQGTDTVTINGTAVGTATLSCTITGKKTGATDETWTGTQNITVTAAAVSPSVSASVSSVNAGESITFTASPAGSEYTYTWPSTPAGLTRTSGGGSTDSSVTFTGNDVTADQSGTLSVTVTRTDGGTGTASTNYNVKAMSLSSNSGTLQIGSSIDLSTLLQNKGNRSITYSLTAGGSYASLNGSILTANHANSGNATATVSITSGATTLTYTATIPQKTSTLAFNTSSLKIMNGASVDLSSYLSASTNGQAITWSNSGLGTLSGTIYTAPASGTGTATVNVSVPNSQDYTAANASITLNVVGNYTISPSQSSITLTGVNNYSTFTVNSNNNAAVGTIRVSSNNPSYVSVSPATGIAGTTVFTVTGVTTNTSATITITGDNSSNTATIPVTVGNPTPTIDRSNTHYSASISTSYLKKSTQPSMEIHVQVTSPNVSYVYLYRSNIRTYVSNSSYNTHPSTYVYTIPLNSNGYGVATINGQYNGSTYYTIKVTNSNGTVTDTYQLDSFTVSGYTTMPQTGPDYTWAYVCGGLCVAALATAVTLNVRKRKHEEN